MLHLRCGITLSVDASLISLQLQYPQGPQDTGIQPQNEMKLRAYMTHAAQSRLSYCWASTLPSSWQESFQSCSVIFWYSFFLDGSLRPPMAEYREDGTVNLTSERLGRGNTNLRTYVNIGTCIMSPCDGKTRWSYRYHQINRTAFSWQKQWRPGISGFPAGNGDDHLILRYHRYDNGLNHIPPRDADWRESGPRRW